MLRADLKMGGGSCIFHNTPPYIFKLTRIFSFVIGGTKQKKIAPITVGGTHANQKNLGKISRTP